MTQFGFDEDLARQLDAAYRRRDIVRRRGLVRAAVGATPGERIVDVGCGPGYYVAELAEAVGDEGAVVGFDPSPAMLAVAAERCADLANSSLAEGDASALPADDASFDAALAVQVMEYVADVPAALAEIHRVLRPGGRAVIWDVDWSTVSWHSGDPERMELVLRAWDQHVVHPALPRTLASELRAAGFEDVVLEAHAFATTELTAEAYGGSVAELIVPFVTALGHEEEAQAWAAEQRELGERGEFYFAVVQTCFSARRA